MFLTVVYLVGIIAEGISAALSAGRLRFDLFGVITLACVTAFGGGVARDVLLNNYPLTWVAHPGYLLAVVAAALITASLSFLAEHFRVLFLVADAIGLAAFSVLGTQIAFNLGHGVVIACVASVVTGVVGGVMRDLLCARIPIVLTHEFYASVCFIITGMMVLLDALHVSADWAAAIAVAAGLVIRLVAVRARIHLPVFDYGAAPLQRWRRGGPGAAPRAPGDAT